MSDRLRRLRPWPKEHTLPSPVPERKEAHRTKPAPRPRQAHQAPFREPIFWHEWDLSRHGDEDA